MDPNVSAVVLLVGLAVGVDYSLFYLKREREERAAGKSTRAALEAAAATSGRSVLISGLTVMVAMAGMLFSGDKTYLSFGIATMIVVAVAMLGSLTVLPALLVAARRPGREGPDPVHRPAPPRAAARTASGRRCSTPALRHPLVAAVAAGGRARRARAARRCTSTPPSPGLDALPQSIADRRDARPDPGPRSRAAPTPALVAIKAEHGRSGHDRRRSPTSRRRRSRPAR